MKRPAFIALLMFAGSNVDAHEVGGDGSNTIWTNWNLDLYVVLPLLLASAFYAIGVARLWQRAGIGHGISRRAASSFVAGLLVIAIALLSPLDAISSAMFSAHMVQHLLLILAAPPLIVAGESDVALLWSLPRKWRRGWGRFTYGFARRLQGENRSMLPLCVVLLATAVLWLWHVPRFYELALQNELIHWAEHVGFFVTALLFWTSIIRLRPHDHSGNGLRILYVFGMAVQGSLLGALITFTAYPLYASHIEAAPSLGVSAILDQRIAGLIMWVPPAALYIAVTAYLFIRWLERAAARHRVPPAIQNRGPNS